jgi:hypothetical protein
LFAGLWIILISIQAEAVCLLGEKDLSSLVDPQVKQVV